MINILTFFKSIVNKEKCLIILSSCFVKKPVFVHWKYVMPILHWSGSLEPTLHCHTFFHLKNIKLGHRRNNHSSLLYRSNMPKKIKAF
jgi:hypothetical protein